MNQISLVKNKIYSEEEIVSIIKLSNPSFSDTHIKWELFEMQKKNQITKVGLKKYVYGSKKEYTPSLESNVAKEINSIIDKNFPLVKTVIWETIQLNEWINLLISKNTIFVEVELGFESIVFDKLFNLFGNKYIVLLNPSIEMIYRYASDNLIVIKTLFSRSPINKKRKTIMAEKLIVDIVADKYLSGLLGTSGIKYIINGIKRDCTFNESKVFTYARRRNKEKEVKAFLGLHND